VTARRENRIENIRADGTIKCEETVAPPPSAAPSVPHLIGPCPKTPVGRGGGHSARAEKPSRSAIVIDFHALTFSRPT
jgi:hypothetical protein